MREIKYDGDILILCNTRISTYDHYLAFEELLNIGDFFYIEQTKDNIVKVIGYEWPCDGAYYAFYGTEPAIHNGCPMAVADAMFYFLNNNIPFTFTVTRKKQQDVRRYPVAKGRSHK